MVRRCARCGCYLSRFALPHERYCFPCHPAIESAVRLCAHGHPLDVYGVARTNGRRYCGECRRANERARYARAIPVGA